MPPCRRVLAAGHLCAAGAASSRDVPEHHGHPVSRRAQGALQRSCQGTGRPDTCLVSFTAASSPVCRPAQQRTLVQALQQGLGTCLHPDLRWALVHSLAIKIVHTGAFLLQRSSAAPPILCSPRHKKQGKLKTHQCSPCPITSASTASSLAPAACGLHRAHMQACSGRSAWQFCSSVVVPGARAGQPPFSSASGPGSGGPFAG